MVYEGLTIKSNTESHQKDSTLYKKNKNVVMLYDRRQYQSPRVYMEH